MNIFRVVRKEYGERISSHYIQKRCPAHNTCLFLNKIIQYVRVLSEKLCVQRKRIKIKTNYKRLVLEVINLFLGIL